MSIGFAPCAMQLAASLLNLILTRSLLHYGGDLAISGMGIVFSINTIFMMPLFGINQGVQPIVGFNYGAKQHDRVKEALRLGIFGATGVVTVGWILTRLFPIQLISLFGSGDAELGDGCQRNADRSRFPPSGGFQVVGTSYFQAVGSQKRSLLVSFRQLLLLIPALLIIPRFFGLVGVYVSLPVADVGSTLLRQCL